MSSARRVGLFAVAGVGIVLGGMLVLRSNGAANVGVDPYANPPETRDWLDNLTAWNGTREVGAVLVVLGLGVMVGALGVLVGAARGLGLSRRPVLLGTVLAAILMVGGVVIFAQSPQTEITYEGSYRLLRAPAEMPPVVLATMVWTRTQTLAALVTMAGLLVACATGGEAVGRRRRRPGDISRSEPRA